MILIVYWQQFRLVSVPVCLVLSVLSEYYYFPHWNPDYLFDLFSFLETLILLVSSFIPIPNPPQLPSPPPPHPLSVSRCLSFLSFQPFRRGILTRFPSSLSFRRLCNFAYIFSTRRYRLCRSLVISTNKQLIRHLRFETEKRREKLQEKFGIIRTESR
jgi:hypothetical protein